MRKVTMARAVTVATTTPVASALMHIEWMRLEGCTSMCRYQVSTYDRQTYCLVDRETRSIPHKDQTILSAIRTSATVHIIAAILGAVRRFGAVENARLYVV